MAADPLPPSRPATDAGEDGAPRPAPSRGTVAEVARVFFLLGAIGFGGPVAHVALMEREVVRARRWLPPDEFLDLLGLTNLIPGPNSSEMAMALGYRRAGWAGLAASVALFALTTRTDELVDDLERRGLGRRGAFILMTAIGTVPRLGERAREIVEAQRSRGLDTEGGPLSRARGLLPLAGPLVLSALTEVEHRTMAIEARAFTAPGKRTVLRVYPDSTAQRALRWSLVGLAVVLIGAVVSGRLDWLP